MLKCSSHDDLLPKVKDRKSDKVLKVAMATFSRGLLPSEMRVSGHCKQSTVFVRFRLRMPCLLQGEELSKKEHRLRGLESNSAHPEKGTTVKEGLDECVLFSDRDVYCVHANSQVLD